MPAIVEMRLRPSRPIEPTTRQLHGLACAVFEGTYSASHVGQDKQFTIWPLNPDPDGWLPRGAWLPPGLPPSVLAFCGQLRIGSVTCAVTDLAFRPRLPPRPSLRPATHRGPAHLPLPDLLHPERHPRRPARPPPHRKLPRHPPTAQAARQRPLQGGIAHRIGHALLPAVMLQPVYRSLSAMR